jgi:fatty-acid peroxygenase
MVSDLPPSTGAYGVLGRWRKDRTLAQVQLGGRGLSCLGGAAGAALFYEGPFERASAVPLHVQRSLFGIGGVQVLDGDPHLRRKALFLDCMAEPTLDGLCNRFDAALDAAASRWRSRPEVVFFDEIADVLCESVCGWVGLPCPGQRVELTRQLISLVEGFAAVGPRYRRAVRDRRRLETWVASLVVSIRTNGAAAGDGSIFERMAFHEETGQLLEPRVVAVELLNIVRPTVALAWFGVFAAHALGSTSVRPTQDEPGYQRFVHEVRRWYPFAPALGARATEDIKLDGHRIRAGRLVVLDIFGTNHDPRSWDEPWIFDPDRFVDRAPKPFDLVSQGGGDTATGHRCAGETLSVAILTRLVRFLVERVSYRLPPQDLRLPMWRVPTSPVSGVVLTDVRPA